jgi:hypothetical protein
MYSWVTKRPATGRVSQVKHGTAYDHGTPEFANSHANQAYHPQCAHVNLVMIDTD